MENKFLCVNGMSDQRKLKPELEAEDPEVSEHHTKDSQIGSEKEAPGVSDVVVNASLKTRGLKVKHRL